jgi:hypothetical protein
MPLQAHDSYGELNCKLTPNEDPLFHPKGSGLLPLLAGAPGPMAWATGAVTARGEGRGGERGDQRRDRAPPVTAHSQSPFLPGHCHNYLALSQSHLIYETNKKIEKTSKYKRELKAA